MSVRNVLLKRVRGSHSQSPRAASLMPSATVRVKPSGTRRHQAPSDMHQLSGARSVNGASSGAGGEAGVGSVQSRDVLVSPTDQVKASLELRCVTETSRRFLEPEAHHPISIATGALELTGCRVQHWTAVTCRPDPSGRTTP